MNKKWWTFPVLFIVIAILVPAYAMAVQDTPPTIPTPPGVSNNTALLFLGNKNIAPVVYLDGTIPTGVAVDIVHALAKHVSQPIEIKAMDWSEAQALVARGDADALIQINPTEERKKIYDFSDPLLESHFSIFTRTEQMGITGLSSLRGLRVGVESGGLPQRLLETDPEVRITIVPNFTEGFRQLSEGSVDAVVVDYRIGSYVLAKNTIRNIKISGDPIESSRSTIAVKKGDTKLLNEINTALQIIREDGTYQKIIDKWQPTEVVFETKEQITNRIYYGIILALLILFLIVIVWSVTIKKELAGRKAAEEVVREQYSTLQGIINSATAIIFSVDRQYRYTSFNKGHAAAMKALYDADIELGHSKLEYITVSEDRDIARSSVDRALAGEQLVGEEYRGEELRLRKFFQISHSPIRSKGDIIGVAVIAQDITERKTAEDKLKESEEKFRVVFENANDAIILVAISPEGLPEKFIEVNETACRRMKYTRDEFLRLSVKDIDAPETWETIQEHMKNLMEKGHATFEGVHVTKDGERIPVEISAHTFHLRGQGLILAHVRDITERKKAEDQIRASLDEKVILLREIHHRVKNNLQIIISLLNLQSRYVDDEKTRQALRESQNRVRAMSHVHEKLYQSPDITRIDLDSYIRFLGESLFQFYGMKGKGITLSTRILDINVDISTAIPVGLIVNELVSNSLKHAFPDGKKGEISLAVKRQDHTLTILFKDTGIGIPSDFDWRNAESLGLRLVCSLVEQLDGTIELDRTTGTAFTIVVMEK
jgi:PAS domain S-box-containing protein